MGRQRQLLDHPQGGRVLKHPRRAQRGMTLIELMVGLALTALLVMLSVPTFTTGMQNRQIRNAAEAIQNGLNVARTEALRRNRIVKFELVGGSGWRVGCDPVDATVVDGEENCPATLQTRDAGEGSASAAVANIQLDAAGAEIGGGVFAGALRFTPLGRVTPDTLPGGHRAEFRITNPAGGTCQADGGEMRCLSVMVSAMGQVRMCDRRVVAPDPRAC